MDIVKRDGRAEPFDGNKLATSLIERGVPVKIALNISESIETHDDITTVEIDERVHQMLKEKDPSLLHLLEVNVRTGNSDIEPFDKQKIVDSLLKETTIDKKTAEKIARKVDKKLAKLKIHVVTGPLIREFVCVQLLEAGLEDARNDYSRLGLPVADVTDMIEKGTKENANLHHNPETIHKLAGDAIIRAYAMTKVLPRKLVDAHLRGELHCHDSDYFAVRPNCMQHDLSWFFHYGLKVDGTGNHTSVAAPPKHAMVAALHAAKILASSQTNMAGGQSLDNFNIFMAPFFENMPYEEVKQVAQAFVYEMNMQYVARGGQVVFSNICIELTIPKYIADLPAYGPCGVAKGTYKDYYDEMFTFTNALLDVFIEGDATGKPHLFPNIIVKVRPSAFTNPAEIELLFKVHALFAKYGTPYILNMCAPWQHDAVNSMGCRTRLSGDWADLQGYDNPGMATMRTGNIHYITLNLPRIALDAKRDPARAKELLIERLDMARDILTIKHNIIEKRLYQNKVLPFLAQKGGDGEDYYRFKDLTHTFGFCGLNEFVQMINGTQLHESKGAQSLGMDVLRTMREYANELQDSTGWRWTLTQSPAETAAGRFARLDMKYYPNECIAKGRGFSPYYTNSSHLAVDADVPLFERATVEGSMHQLCNGGHITHLFLGEAAPNVNGLMSLTEKLCKNTGMGLFDYTRDLSVCSDCKQSFGGLKSTCPNCGSTHMESYSRITGYMQAVSGWQNSKLSELHDRKRYDL